MQEVTGSIPVVSPKKLDNLCGFVQQCAGLRIFANPFFKRRFLDRSCFISKYKKATQAYHLRYQHFSHTLLNAARCYDQNSVPDPLFLLFPHPSKPHNFSYSGQFKTHSIRENAAQGHLQRVKAFLRALVLTRSLARFLASG